MVTSKFFFSNPHIFGRRFQICGQIFSPKALIFLPQLFYENHHLNGRYKAFFRQIFSPNWVIFTQSSVYHQFCLVSLADGALSFRSGYSTSTGDLKSSECSTRSPV